MNRLHCGFTDVRRDRDGYYCSVCGKRMDKTWEMEAEREHLPLPASEGRAP